jgi:hypothetical protein
MNDTPVGMALSGALLNPPHPFKTERYQPPGPNGSSRSPALDDLTSVTAEPDAKRDHDKDIAEVAAELHDLENRMVEAPALARRPEPQVKWIVENVILDETVTLFTGNGGTGKSRAALLLAVAMRSDGEWLGIRVTQGPVLFLTSEDSLDDVHIMLRANLEAEQKSVAHCAGLHLMSLADRDACLASALSRLAPLEATPLWRALELLIERIGPRLVILDALADLFGGEEIYRRHARSFMVLLKRLAIRLKLAVILIAHPSLAGMNSGSGLSGSTDWHNASRGRLYLEKPHDKDKSVHPAVRTLTVMKVQHAEEGMVFRLRLREGALAYEGKEGGGVPFDKAVVAAKAESAFIACLRTFEEQGRRVSPNPSASYAPSVFEKEPEAEGVKKVALARAMSTLLKQNRIHVENTGRPSRPVERLVLGPTIVKASSEK